MVISLCLVLTVATPILCHSQTAQEYRHTQRNFVGETTKAAMTSKLIRKVGATDRQRMVSSSSDSSTSVERRLRSVSPRQINRIEEQNCSSNSEPVRYPGYPIKTRTPFNRMLSTSTPDPEKHVMTANWTDCGTLPTRNCSKRPPKALPPPVPSSTARRKIKRVPPAKKCPVTPAQHKTYQINRKSNPPSTTLSSAPVFTDDASSVDVPHRNAYILSVHQVNKMSPALETIHNKNKSKSAFDSVGPLPKHGQQSSSSGSSTPSNVPNTVTISNNVQNPSVAPLTVTDLPMSSVSNPLPYQSTDLLNYKYSYQSCNPANNNDIASHSARNQATLNAEAMKLLGEAIESNRRTITTTTTTTTTTSINYQYKEQHQVGTGRDILKGTLQSPDPISVQNSRRTPPISSHAFLPINPGNSHVSFEEPVRDNNNARSTQLNQSKSPPLCSYNSTSAPSNPTVLSTSGNIRNGTKNNNARPAVYSSWEHQKCHHNGPGVDGKEKCCSHGNDYNINLQWQSVEALAGAKTLKFIINELTQTCKSTNHTEIIRMVNQLQDITNTLPQLQDTFDLQTEFSLALQPLRSENNQLYKKLRNLADEKARVEKKMTEDHRREMLELQLQLLTLEKQVDEEKLQNQQQLHHQQNVIKDLKTEHQSLVKDIGNRDSSELSMRLKTWEENQQLTNSVQQTKQQLAVNRLNLELSEKKNHILQVTLEQRDREISNMYDVISSVRNAMREVLENIGNANRNMTTTDSLEKVLELLCQETDPEASSSVMSSCSTSKPKKAASIVPQVSPNAAAVATTDVATNAVVGENSCKAALKESTPEKYVGQKLQSLLETISCIGNPGRDPFLDSDFLEDCGYSPNKNNNIAGLVGTTHSFEPVVINGSKGLTNSHSPHHHHHHHNQQAERLETSAVKDNGQHCRNGISSDVFSISSCLEQSFNSEDMGSTSGRSRASIPKDRANTSGHSRASISDYFQKYPRTKPIKGFVDIATSSIGLYGTGTASQHQNKTTKTTTATAAANQILCDSHWKTKDDNNSNVFHTIEEDYDDDNDVDGGMNLSQYTINTESSSLNADLLNFQNGLASLDADIAQLEQSMKEGR
ncbi:uncharacterized protein LOC115215940 isoform X1 [Argonauta hians]